MNPVIRLGSGFVSAAQIPGQVTGERDFARTHGAMQPLPCHLFSEMLTASPHIKNRIARLGLRARLQPQIGGFPQGARLVARAIQCPDVIAGQLRIGGALVMVAQCLPLTPLAQVL